MKLVLSHPDLNALIQFRRGCVVTRAGSNFDQVPTHGTATQVIRLILRIGTSEIPLKNHNIRAALSSPPFISGPKAGPLTLAVIKKPGARPQVSEAWRGLADAAMREPHCSRLFPLAPAFSAPRMSTNVDHAFQPITNGFPSRLTVLMNTLFASRNS